MLDAARTEAQAMIEGGEQRHAEALEILHSLAGQWKRRLDLARVG